MEFDRPGLIALIKSEFKLDWHGIHGASHWARVLKHEANNFIELAYDWSTQGYSNYYIDSE